MQLRQSSSIYDVIIDEEPEEVTDESVNTVIASTFDNMYVRI